MNLIRHEALKVLNKLEYGSAKNNFVGTFQSKLR